MPTTQTLASANPAITQGPLRVQSSHGDWRDDLHANGFVVIKQAIPRDRAIQYQQRAFDWL
ncbi:hypothetical protein ABOM_000704 [Aspergillus bombycis]|uniref:Phytanoyl-CoA dioxygenase family protein n=1 Tax=Aspergillus bombycis TaxID=109264 RepID=A0A1F8AHH0_9EURO|nr:hypothetical protein ABOM_000704 [Aspergillus bombycis]OGM50738.1 hypothetical protein ABOM_000704 [Aspergillus bombycis]